MIGQSDSNKLKGVRNMKESKHQAHSFEDTLEMIEKTIEQMEPGRVVRLCDITGTKMDKQINSATVMLLKKYGITYRE